MRFEVPQFIEIEDKIFGPLTWRQFLYLSGGVGLGVVIFLVFPFVIFVIIGLPLALLGAALSFYSVNNRPFSYFLEAIFNYVKGQRLYLWRQKEAAVHKNAPVYSGRVGPNAQTPKRDISSLARQLELEAIKKQE